MLTANHSSKTCSGPEVLRSEVNKLAWEDMKTNLELPYHNQNNNQINKKISNIKQRNSVMVLYATKWTIMRCRAQTIAAHSKTLPKMDLKVVSLLPFGDVVSCCHSGRYENGLQCRCHAAVDTATNLMDQSHSCCR